MRMQGSVQKQPAGGSFGPTELLTGKSVRSDKGTRSDTFDALRQLLHVLVPEAATSFLQSAIGAVGQMLLIIALLHIQRCQISTKRRASVACLCQIGSVCHAEESIRSFHTFRCARTGFEGKWMLGRVATVTPCSPVRIPVLCMSFCTFL